jgi:hypothetical protein
MPNRESLHACNPSFAIYPQNPDYYLDLVEGRGDDVVKRLRRAIILSPNKPTLQFLSGHAGSGKTTELFRLKAGLEQQGFAVIYCAADQYLQIDNVGLTEIWLLILNLILQQVEKKGESLSLAYLPNAIMEIEQWLRLSPPIGIASYTPRLQRILQTIQDNAQQRRQLRHHLEARLKNSLLAAGEEVTAIEVDRLKQMGKKGLVILIDNLDRLTLEKSEIIFGDGGKYLRQFQCHIIYTLPLLAIAEVDPQSPQRLQQSLNVNKPIVLSPLALRDRQGEIKPHVLNLLRQVILSRLLPNISADKRLEQVPNLFDHLETLDRLCMNSHGHLPYLLSLLYGCLQWQNLPIQMETLTQVLQIDREVRLATISDRDRQALQKYLTSPHRLTPESISLCRRLLMFEQHDLDGKWFISPFA